MLVFDKRLILPSFGFVLRKINGKKIEPKCLMLGFISDMITGYVAGTATFAFLVERVPNFITSLLVASIFYGLCGGLSFDIVIVRIRKKFADYYGIKPKYDEKKDHTISVLKERVEKQKVEISKLKKFIRDYLEEYPKEKSN